MPGEPIDPYSFSIVRLKSELKSRNQDLKGTKSDLVTRLINCIDEEELHGNGNVHVEENQVAPSTVNTDNAPVAQPEVAQVSVAPAVVANPVEVPQQVVPEEQVPQQMVVEESFAAPEQTAQMNASAENDQILNRMKKFGTNASSYMIEKIREEKKSVASEQITEEQKKIEARQKKFGTGKYSEEQIKIRERAAKFGLPIPEFNEDEKKTQVVNHKRNQRNNKRNQRNNNNNNNNNNNRNMNRRRNNNNNNNKVISFSPEEQKKIEARKQKWATFQ
ncbi:hypothetical protein WA158_004878 [Blastocystis sp. Blastoise]